MTENYRINLLVSMPEWFVAYINKNIFLYDDFQYTTMGVEWETC
jgi:hypothetical protein